jgi:antitoxin VapB
MRGGAHSAPALQDGNLLGQVIDRPPPNLEPFSHGAPPPPPPLVAALRRLDAALTHVYIFRGKEVEMVRTTKVFQDGNSQAVRIPKEFNLAAKELFIHQVGNALVLLPATAPLPSFQRGLAQKTAPDITAFRGTLHHVQTQDVRDEDDRIL